MFDDTAEMDLDGPDNDPEVNAEVDPVINFEKLFNVVKTRVAMQEGYVRQKPHMLKKLSSSIIAEVTALEAQLEELDVPEDRRLLVRDELITARNSAMMYFEASSGINEETLSLSLVAPSESKSDDIFKLKGLRPPLFSGNLREFTQWKQHFDAAVHNNMKLTDDHRMVHLMSSVRSIAREFLRGYPAIGTYYNEAYDALSKRFGDPTKLAQTFYADLAALPELYNMGSGAVTLAMERKNIDEIKTIILNLQATGNFDTELVQGWVLKKVAKSRARGAFGNLVKDHPKLDFSLFTLLETLESQIYVDEVLELRIASVNKGEAPEANSSMNEKFTTLVNKSKLKGKGNYAPRRQTPPHANKRRTGCLFCSGLSHSAMECRNYLTVAARMDRLRELQRCSVCLSPDHAVRNCPDQARACRTCYKAGHSSATCFQAIVKMAKAIAERRKSSRRNEDGGPSAKRSRESASTSRPEKRGTFLETFISYIEIQGKVTLVRGILDGGSDVSYVCNSVLERLRLEKPPKLVINVQGIGSHSYNPVDSGRLMVKFMGHNRRNKTFNLYTTDHIVASSRLAPSSEATSTVLPINVDYADPDIFSSKPRPIEILLGNDVRNSVVKLNRDKRLDANLLLRPTIFGWIPSGRATKAAGAMPFYTTALTKRIGTNESTTEPDSSVDLSFLWDLETLGIKVPQSDSVDDLVIEQFRKTTRFEGGRYVVCWPRKAEKLNLPSHYRMCAARCRQVLRSLDRDVLEQYDQIIREQLEENVIERAPRETPYDIHYIPHKAVLREGKAPRIVYDASAKTKSSLSLNDMLHTGPSLTKNLVGTLIGFLLRECGLSADIEGAFLRVGLDQADRDLVRFLWVEDYTQPIDEVKFVVYRFTRTPFGVGSSPFLLNMVLQEHLSNGDNVWYQFAKDRFYVDNFVASVSTVVDAVELYESLVGYLAQGGFNLRDWTSNSREFVNSLPFGKGRNDDEERISILGLNWNRSKDTLSIKFKDEGNSSSVTLRTALSTLQAVFDPLGWCAPCILDLKLFIQDCWKIKATWDKELPSSMEAQFRKLLADREYIKEIEVPRYPWSTSSNEGTYDLHCFCDASKSAYGCCLYLVHKTQGRCEAQLIYTKSRVAPIRARSIPQLELLAVTVGGRTIAFIRNHIELKINRFVIWTDATTVLQWLASTRVQSQFVQNRLKELREARDVVFKYVPTKDNPADILSRGQKALQLKNNRLWWKGPSWLVIDRLWSEHPINAPAIDTSTTSVITLANITLESSRSNSKVISVPFVTDEFEKRYNNWDACVNRILRIPPLIKLYNKSQLSRSDAFARAELVLIRLVQQKYFHVELQGLQDLKTIDSNLNLFLHTDGIIRCQGRLDNAPVHWDSSHPIYLPRQSTLVRTLILSVHKGTLHAGSEHTLTTFRERFWITKGRSLVNSVIHRCVLCRRWKGGPYRLPPMPPLPHIRMTPVVPFYNVGVDCFGPYYIYYDDPNKLSKVYGIIFTCLVTRAIHLELAGDLSGDQFLQALVRFTSRRGIPSLIVSDNGRNLTFVQPLLGHKVEISDPKVDTFVTSKGINWHFIPSYSPWEGGVYERLIGLVKNSLFQVIGTAVVNYIRLTTALCQVEEVVNNRPLTYVSAGEIVDILTPSHFLRPAREKTGTQIELIDTVVSSASNLIPGYKASKAIVDHYSSLFYTRYLQMLRERHIQKHPAPKGAVSFTPDQGHVVLVKVSNSSRAKWPLGVIESLDSRKSHASVRIIDWTASKKISSEQARTQLYRTKIIQRPINSLYPLEIPPEDTKDSSTSTPKRPCTGLNPFDTAPVPGLSTAQ